MSQVPTRENLPESTQATHTLPELTGLTQFGLIEFLTAFTTDELGIFAMEMIRAGADAATVQRIFVDVASTLHDRIILR